MRTPLYLLAYLDTEGLDVVGETMEDILSTASWAPRGRDSLIAAMIECDVRRIHRVCEAW